jgi:glycosyltransferase involved in cell wall biosynthesis
MFDLATTGIIGFSIFPLRIATYLGLFISLCAMLGGIVVIIQKLLGVETLVRGWASIMLSLFFLSGIQLFILGVLGEYVGRIYREVQARPLYIVKEKIGFTE